MKTTPDIPALSRRFCELTGMVWHDVNYDDNSCSCGERFASSTDTRSHEINTEESNPDFSDVREVLKVMKERKDWSLFRDNVLYEGIDLNIDDYILDTTGRMLEQAVKFLEAKHEIP